MNKKVIEPKGYKLTPYYSSAISVCGGETLFISGQTCYDQDRNFNFEDLPSQIDRSLINLKAILNEAKAEPSDIVMIRIYIKEYNPRDHLHIVTGKLSEFFSGCVIPASTLLGVQSLALDGLLFEIEAIAAIKHSD